MLENIIIGVLLGFSLYKMGELIINIIYRNKFQRGRFEKVLLVKKKLFKKITLLMWVTDLMSI